MEEPAGLRPRASFDVDADAADGEGVWAVEPEESQDTARRYSAEGSQVLEVLEAQVRDLGQGRHAFHLARQ
jgi:hypothetical protein